MKKILFLLAFVILNFSEFPINSDTLKNSSIKKVDRSNFLFNSPSIISQITWSIINSSKEQESLQIWKKYESSEIEENLYQKEKSLFRKKSLIREKALNSLNRSIVIGDVVGPDISWIIPPGFKWTKKHYFDLHARGHNTIIPEPQTRNFFGWNDGDAVGLISYQFFHKNNSSFGFNLGVRSLYQGDGASGGHTSIGEGLSAGFRWDSSLSPDSGYALGAEQLIHFDESTDTGRNIYITASKGWWSSTPSGDIKFPLYVGTAGIGTGRMAVGTIKGLCSNSLGGAGTEEGQYRKLCWSPVFSVASVWNNSFSTFLEYNSRFFILGTSVAPLKKTPIRGTFGLILSDHVDNYKLHNGSEMNWVFNISLGF